MANAVQITVLDEFPDGTPIPNHTPFRHRDHHTYATVGNFRANSFINNPVPRYIFNEEVVLILTHPTFFSTQHNRLRNPVAYRKYLSDTRLFSTRKQFDDVTYEVGFLRKMKIVVPPMPHFRPGPVFFLESKKKRHRGRNLSRTIYTMNYHNVPFRLIEYGLAQLPPVIPDEEFEEAVHESDEDADHEVEQNMQPGARGFNNE